MLVGRDSERRALSALVSAARIGQSGVLVVVGEAGIGKTALLDDLVGKAVDMDLLRITGVEAERDLPFAGLGRILRPTADDLARLPTPQAEALGIALALRPGVAVDRFAVGAAALTLLTHRSEDEPLCLIVDDAHLLDRPSQEVFAFVARRLLADAVLIVAAARSGEPCLLLVDDVPQMVLGGLDAVATRELVTQLVGEPAPLLADRMHDLAAGNPLAVKELAADPARLQALPPDLPVPVPVTLSALYARRADGLPTPARRVVQVAATAGEDLAVVSRACALLGLEVAALAEAESDGLVRIELDRVRFVHPLARSALYAAIPPAERRRLHAAVATALGDSDPDRRAWHRVEAALGPDEAAAAEIDGLGRRSADRGGYAVAAAAFDRAARLSVSVESRAERWLAAGLAAWRGGDGPWARSLLQQAIAVADLPRVRATAERTLGIIAARTGSIDEAHRLLVAAAEQSAAEDRGGAVVCLAEAVNACFYRGDAAGAVAAAERIDELLEGDLPDEAEALGLMAAGMARVLAGENGTEQIRAGVLRQSTAQPSSDPDRVAWHVLGALFLRDSTSGRELVRRTVEQRRAQAAIGALPHLLFQIARDSAASDRWPNAEADYGEAIAIARELGQNTELAISLSGLAWLEARQGRADETLTHATEAERLCVSHQIHLGRIWCLFARGDLRSAEGDLSVALDCYRSLAELLDELGVADVDLAPLPELADALVRTGRPDEADELGRDYLRRAEAKAQPWALARARRTRGLTCPTSDIDAWFGGALDLHRRTLDCFELARTLLAYGARLRRARRRVDARVQLEAALAEFTRLGARPWAAMAADELEATGVTADRAGGDPTEQLTPRELQIALSLAEGRTTRQVAAALFLSPKTVEYHLRHVYLKFGIESRAELSHRMTSR